MMRIAERKMGRPSRTVKQDAFGFQLAPVNFIRAAGVKVFQTWTGEGHADSAFILRTRDDAAQAASRVEHLDAHGGSHIIAAQRVSGHAVTGALGFSDWRA